MMKKIKDFFSQNILIKLAALGIASLLWLAGMNLNNPKTIQPREITLVIKNEDKLEQANRILLNKESLEDLKITVRVRASVLELQNLKSSEIEAYIDLGLIENLTSDLSGQPIPTTVFVKAPYEVVGVYPNTIDVSIESKITMEKDVKVVLENQVSEDYAPLTPTVQPKKIRVTGARSLVVTADRAEVFVDVSNRSESFITEENIKIFDIDGKDITDRVTLSQDAAFVEVPIYEILKVPIVFADTFAGEPAFGHVVTGMTTEPKEVSVIGRPEQMRELKSIQLDPIDIANATNNVQVELNIRDYLPPDISLVYGTESIIQIEVTVEEQEIKDLKIPVSDIQVTIEETEDMLEYAFVDEEVEVSIKGAKSWIESIEATDILLSLQLDVREPGEYEMEVTYILPENTELVGQSPIVIVKYIDIEEPGQGDDAEPTEEEPSGNVE